MSSKQVTNVTASIAARIKNWAAANSRTFQNRFEIPDGDLCNAINRTFARRGTIATGGVPLCFTEAFAADQKKAVQWKAYLRKNQITEGCPDDFAEVARFVARKLLPLVQKSTAKE